MKNYLLICLTFFAATTFAQTSQKEINEQVWKPFLQAFNNLDAKGFMTVHSKEVVRSPRDSKEVWNWDEYYRQQDQGDQREKAAGFKRTLELRFTERIENKDQAIDVGIYKTTSIRADGTSRSFYGRFHVVLRKENGVWKFLSTPIHPRTERLMTLIF